MVDGRAVKALVYDHQSGAREISARLLELLQRQATQSKAETSTGLVEELFDSAVKVVRGHPEMAILFNAVDESFRRLEVLEDSADGVGGLRIEAVATLEEVAKDQREASRLAAVRAAAMIESGDVVLTHSRSSTVERALLIAQQDGQVFDVVVTESRPNLEGRTLAQRLSQHQVPVRLIVDAAAAAAVDGADRVLVGADAVLPTSFVNKVGTRAMASMARDTGVPVAVVTEASKAWRLRADPAVGMGRGRAHEPKEVWQRPPLGIEVVNVPFERVDSSLASVLVTESQADGFSRFWANLASVAHARRMLDVFGSELGPEA